MSLARKNSILSKTINVDHSANGDTLFIPHSGIVNISGILTATSGNFSSQTVFASGSAATPGISIIGDTDTGISQLATNTLSIMTSGTERLTVNSGGNIGIGSNTNNSNIRARLQICGPDADDDPSLGSGTGALLVTNSDSAYGMQFGVSADGVGWIQQGRVDGTATAYNLLLNPVGGNVGIGTSSPQQKFVVSNAGAEGMEIIPALNANESRIQTYNRSTSAWNKFSINCSTFELFTNGGTTTIFGNASGNVGIGTTSPSTKLQINGQTRVTDGTTNIDFVSSSAVGYIGTQTNHPLVLRTNDTERMRIGSNGNVTIGEPNTSNCRLMIAGTSSNISAARATYEGTLQINENSLSSLQATGGIEFKASVFGSGYGVKLCGYDNGSFVIGNRANSATWTERFVISQGGNVGIGTTSPSYRLHLEQSGSASTVLSSFLQPSLTTGNFNQIYFGRTGASHDCGTITYSTNATAANSTLSLGLYGTSFTLNVNGNGNVGIGTTSPPELLSVFKDNNAGRTSILIDNLDQRLKMSCYYESGVGQYSEIQSTNNAETGHQVLILNRQGGNVAIGTTNPSAKLLVSGSGEVINGSANGGSGTTNYGVLGQATGAATNNTGFYANASNATNNYGVRIVAPAAGANNWAIYSDATAKSYFAGNTGIGVQPTYRFEVRGSGATSSTVCFYISNSSATALLYIRDDGAINTGAAAVSPYNNVTGTAANLVVGSDGFLYRSTSSLRYKTQINDATHGLNEVLKLRSVTFKSQNDGNKIFGGLIAEEVDSAGLTEFVQYDSENRPDAIHYSNMVSLLIKAIQEQQTQINELKNRLSALEGA